MADRVKPVLPLTTARILDETMRIADEGGIEAVSLRRLAARLGVTPMALYHYVQDKAELLDLMADRLVAQIEPPDDPPGATWQESLRSLGERYLAVIRAHPAAPFLLSRPFDSPAARQLSERILGIFAKAGVAPDTAVPLLQVSTGMLLGPAIHRATYAAAARRRWERLEGASVEGTVTDRPGTWEVADAARWGWIEDLEADRLTLELWLEAVQGLAERREGRGQRGWNPPDRG